MAASSFSIGTANTAEPVRQDASQANDDPFVAKIDRPRELSTKEKLLAIVDEVEVIYETFLSLLASQPLIALDPVVAPLLSSVTHTPVNPDLELSVFDQTLKELISLLAERQKEFMQLLATAEKEAEVDIAIQGLVIEADKLKEQLMTLHSRLKDAEQILANALHMAKSKTEAIKSADDSRLSMDDIIRYAHRISVGFSAAAPGNWVPGDPRRPYPTEMEMRAGLLAKMSTDIPPPPSHIMALPTENLTQVSQKFLGSNAGPYTMSPLPQNQTPIDNSKTTITSTLQREVSAEDQDVETMSSDSSSSSSSEEE